MNIRSIHKKWWFWLLLVVVVGGVYLIIKSQPKITYQTETAIFESLTQTVDVNGEVASIDEVDLAFDVGGSIFEVSVKVGDFVEKGTVLLKLDTTELKADVNAAYQAVQYARANLEKVKVGSKNETVAVSSAVVSGAEALLNVAKIDLENSKTYLQATKERYEADIASAQASVETAKDDLQQIKQSNSQTLSDAYRDLYVSTWAGAAGARSAMVQSDNVIGVRNGFANDDFETVLSSRDTSALVYAKDRFLTAEASLLSSESLLSSISIGSGFTAIMQTARAIEKALDDSQKLLLYTKKVVDATLNTSNFSVSDQATLTASVDSVRNSVQTDQATLENAIQTVLNAISSTANALEDAQNVLASANANLLSTQKIANQQITLLTNSVATSQATVHVREIDVTKAIASLSEVQSSPRAVDLASYEAEVARTVATFESVKSRLEKAQIVSPISGNVTEINGKIGETVTATTTVAVVQTTEQQFKILADISESDIAKVSINDSVRITFDAYSSGAVIKGFIGEIDPAEKIVEGVVYYQATIFFVEDPSISLRPGMSADLVIETDSRSSVISVQQRTLVTKNGSTIIRVLENNNPAEREVITGLRGNLGRIEITSGLNEGDEIIIKEIHE